MASIEECCVLGMTAQVWCRKLNKVQGKATKCFINLKETDEVVLLCLGGNKMREWNGAVIEESFKYSKDEYSECARFQE